MEEQTQSTDHIPPVTIGLAVYNGADLLPRALDSLLAQTFTDFTLLVSDNASTDGTEELCRRYMRDDSRVRYHRHSETTPAPLNFNWVLLEARSEYFMWAAHDDVWEPNFIEQNLTELRANQDAVAAISDVDFINRAGDCVDHVPLVDTCPLTGSNHQNLAEYLSNFSDNSRYYSLFRREALAECIKHEELFWAVDQMTIARTLAYGHHVRTPGCLLHRDCGGESADAWEAIPRYNQTRLGRAIPLLPLTTRMLTDRAIPKSLSLVWTLVGLNLDYNLPGWRQHGVLRQLKYYLRKRWASRERASADETTARSEDSLKKRRAA